MLPERMPEERYGKKRESSEIPFLPLINKLLFVSLLIMAAHLVNAKTGLLRGASPQIAGMKADGGDVRKQADAAPASSVASAGATAAASTDGSAASTAGPGASTDGTAAPTAGPGAPADGTAASTAGPGTPTGGSASHAADAAGSSSASAAAASPAGTGSAAGWAAAKANVGLRIAPDENKPVLLTAVAGEQFPIRRDTGDWLEVGLNDKQTGWMPAKQAEKTAVGGKQAQIVKVKADAKLYRGPGESFGEARDVSAGAVLVPARVSGEWIELAGKTGGQPLWISANEAEWTFGEPPEQDASAHEVKALSAGSAEHAPLAGKTIVIDPGHGGTDPGAIAKTNPVYERDVNLAAAEVLAVKLQAAGARVVMTRTSNDQTVSLEQRAKLSNDNRADVFVSIHQNMFENDPSVSGTITYYDADASKTLAQKVEAAVASELGHTREQERIEQSRFYVLKHNNRPAVLVEGCFLSNPEELTKSLLPAYQEKLAQGIYEGLAAYLNNA